VFNNLTIPSEFLLEWINNKLLPKEEQDVFEEYYKNYIKKFPKRIQFFYDKQLEYAINILLSIDNPKVLEIGCGLGSESLFMALKGADILGIDIKDDRIKTAMKRKEIVEENLKRKLKCMFQNISLLDLDDEHYDLVWIEQAYHHLEPREEISKKIAKLLKPNGYLIISETNAWNLLIQLVLFKNRGFQTVDSYEDKNGKKHVYGNERIITAKTISKIFNRLEISHVHTQYFRLFPNQRFFDCLFEFEKLFPQQLIPFFTHYNYIGKKL